MSMLRFLAALAAASLAVVSAQAQFPPPGSPGPERSTVSLTAPFSPDPYIRTFVAGGEADANFFSQYCLGFVADHDSPDFRVRYQAGGDALTISASGNNSPVTLIVRGPGGAFYCDPTPPPHASANPPPATISREVPMNGVYDIWIGRYNPGPPIPVTLRISGAPTQNSTAQAPRPPPPPELRREVRPNYNLTPAYGSVRLTDARDYRVRVNAGGSVSASGLTGQCFGWIARAPDFRVHWQGAAVTPLQFYVNSPYPTMLVVNDSRGNWHCSAGVPTPRIVFNPSTHGQYDIWVGTIEQGPLRPSVLVVDEILPRMPLPNRGRRGN